MLADAKPLSLKGDIGSNFLAHIMNESFSIKIRNWKTFSLATAKEQLSNQNEDIDEEDI